MNTERAGNESKEQKPNQEKQIHHTHFPVLKIPLKDTGFESGYEWIDLGNGRMKRVPKKKEKEEGEAGN